MKINYIKLTNYAGISHAFDCKTISIDFTKATNKIILLNGPNGSGKTTILSCLHPFANNGNLDVRSNESLIKIGEEGYKEIIIENMGVIYQIKHFYTPSKTSHTVKSYCIKNGIELNPNGNVTSFKNVISEELDIEPDYLKLIRLGSNVTNFINLKSTERKNFMGKILSDVDIYLKFFKKMSNDVREVKSRMSHTMDKLQKLNIIDIDEITDQIKYMTEELDDNNNKLNSLNSELGGIKYALKDLDDSYTIKSNLSLVTKTYEKMEKIIGEYANEDVDKTQKRIDKLNNKISDCQLKISNLNLNIQNSYNTLDDLLSSIKDMEKQLDRINNSDELKEIKYMIEETRKSIDRRIELTHVNKIIDIEYTKKDIEDLIVFLDNNQNILYNAYEYGNKPVAKVCKMITGKENVNGFISDKLDDINRNQMVISTEFVLDRLNNKIPTIVKCMDKNCDLYKFWNEMITLYTSKPDADVEDEEFYGYMKMCYKNIQTVLDNFKDKKTLFSKMPMSIRNLFTLEVVMKKISNCEIIYDKTLLYNELSKVTEYELYQEDVRKLKEYNERLHSLESSNSNKIYFEERLEESLEKKEKLLTDIDEWNCELISYKESLNNYQNDLSNELELKESLEKRDNIKEEINKLKVNYDSCIQLERKMNEINDKINNIKYKIDKLEKDRYSYQYRYTEYKKLNKELNKYKNKYDEMVLVRLSLSSTEGIPIYYIKKYLKDTTRITNDLLDIAFNGKLLIQDFDISADDFRIPYETKGVTISDVIYSSQGEMSFITLALSFALSYQSITNYNILLLDEVDSTFDIKNREKFLQILEKQMDKTEAEQVFTISHNNMFDLYPVDILSTIESEDSSIKIIRE